MVQILVRRYALSLPPPPTHTHRTSYSPPSPTLAPWRAPSSQLPENSSPSLVPSSSSATPYCHGNGEAWSLCSQDSRWTVISAMPTQKLNPALTSHHLHHLYSTMYSFLFVTDHKLLFFISLWCTTRVWYLCIKLLLCTVILICQDLYSTSNTHLL